MTSGNHTDVFICDSIVFISVRINGRIRGIPVDHLQADAKMWKCISFE